MKNETEKHNITYNNNARENIFSQQYCKHVAYSTIIKYILLLYHFNVHNNHNIYNNVFILYCTVFHTPGLFNVYINM